MSLARGDPRYRCRHEPTNRRGVMSEARHERGTEWALWDLHVHTPDSIEHNYGGAETAWPRFVDELEALPRDLKVIAISDYWFLDGYKRLLDHRTSGRMTNLQALFPAIELRLQDFAGSDGNLRRINAHVLFDNTCTPDFIEQQFVAALAQNFQLDPEAEVVWDHTITRTSVEELGRAIKQTVPDDAKGEYGTDLREGFNNLVVPLHTVTELLNKKVLKDKALLILGKSEWSSYKWNSQSIASKKNLINRASAIFTAFEDATDWAEEVSKLKAAGVNHKILDCSDAHNWTSSTNKDRLGNCQTWIRAVPTLAGLRHALDEFEHRVFIGTEPRQLTNTKTRPSKFLQSVAVGPAIPSADKRRFNYDIPLNPGFVAILGNKGQGKSALLDCIAVATNSNRSADFAFLNSRRFLRQGSDASDYIATTRWADGTVDSRKLDGDHIEARSTGVEYLPQSFVERICNARPGTQAADGFEGELRAVLFTHIPIEERAGTDSFDELIDAKRSVTQANIRDLRRNLEAQIRSLIDLQSFTNSQNIVILKDREKGFAKQLEDARRALTQSQERLQQASRDSAANQELSDLAAAIGRLEASERQHTNNAANAAEGLGRVQRLRLEIDTLRAEAASLAERAGAVNERLRDAAAAAGVYLADTPLLSLILNEEGLAALQLDADSRETEFAGQREAALAAADDDRKNKETQQAASALVDAAAERARQAVVDTEARVAAVQGDEADGNSLIGVRHLLQRVTAAPAEIDSLRNQIMTTCKEIHLAIGRERQDLNELYAPASQFMEHHGELATTGLEVSTSLEVAQSLVSIIEALDGRKAADFIGWLQKEPPNRDLLSWSSLGAMLEVFVNKLLLDPEGYQLKGGYSSLRFAVDFLSLSWVKLRFGLTGDGRPLAELSPGQRGLILALFYLLLDRRETPLLLDQPEENLDNETVSGALVPAIKDAVSRRQLVVVTHNANLAVVGDADQILYCQNVDNEFTVTAGALDDIDSARHAVDVLEGTKRALTNRWRKFEALPTN